MLPTLNKMAIVVALSAASPWISSDFVMPTTELSPFIQFNTDIRPSSQVSFYESARDFFLKDGSLPEDDYLTKVILSLPEAEVVRRRTSIVFRMIDREGREITILCDHVGNTSSIVVSHPGHTSDFSQQQLDDNQRYFSKVLGAFCRDFGCTFS